MASPNPNSSFQGIPRPASTVPSTSSFAITPGDDFFLIQENKKGVIVAAGHTSPSMASHTIKATKEGHPTRPADPEPPNFEGLAFHAAKLMDSHPEMAAESAAMLAAVRKNVDAHSFATRGRVFVRGLAVAIPGLAIVAPPLLIITLWFGGCRQIAAKLVEAYCSGRVSRD